MASSPVRLLAAVVEFTSSSILGVGRTISPSNLRDAFGKPSSTPKTPLLAPHASWRLPPRVLSSLPPSADLASLPLACVQGYLSRPAWEPERDGALLLSYSDALATPRDLLALDALCTALSGASIDRAGITSKPRGPRSRSLAPHGAAIDSGDSTAFASFLSSASNCFEALFSEGVPSYTRQLSDQKDSADVMLLSPELHASFRASAGSASTSASGVHKIKVITSRIIDAHIVWEDVTAEPPALSKKSKDVSNWGWGTVSFLGRSTVVSGHAALNSSWITRMFAQHVHFYGLRTASRAAAQVTVAFSCEEERDGAPPVQTLHTLTFEGEAAAPPTSLPLSIRLAFGLPRLETSFPWIIVDVDSWFATLPKIGSPIVTPSTIPIIAASAGIARNSSHDMIADQTRATTHSISGGKQPLAFSRQNMKRAAKMTVLSSALETLATALSQSPRGNDVLLSLAPPLTIPITDGDNTDTPGNVDKLAKVLVTAHDDETGVRDTLAVTLEGAQKITASAETAAKILLCADGPPWATRLDTEIANEATARSTGAEGTPSLYAPIRIDILGTSLATGSLPPVLASPASALPFSALRQFLYFYWLTRSRAQQVEGELSVAHRDTLLLTLIAYLATARACAAATAAISTSAVADTTRLAAVTANTSLIKLIKESDEALLREAVNGVPLTDEAIEAFDTIQNDIVQCVKNITAALAE